MLSHLLPLCNQYSARVSHPGNPQERRWPARCLRPLQWGVPWGCGWARHPAGPPLLRATVWCTRSRGSSLSLATRAARAHDSPHLLSTRLAHPLPPCSTACWWWTPRSVCGHKDAVSIRRRPAPHTRRRGVPGHPPGTTPSSVLASTGACGPWGVYVRETPCVPMGDTPLYVRETPRVPTGDDISPKSLFLQGLLPRRLSRRLYKTTHTTLCVWYDVGRLCGGHTL